MDPRLSCPATAFFPLTPAQILRRQYNECKDFNQAMAFVRSIMWEIELTKRGKRCTFCGIHPER